MFFCSFGILALVFKGKGTLGKTVRLKIEKNIRNRIKKFHMKNPPRSLANN